jgi:hypothetical protein
LNATLISIRGCRAAVAREIRAGDLVVVNSAGTGSDNAHAGTATLRADGEKLNGNLSADGTSTLSATLQDTKLTGSITNAALTLDGTSIWKVSGDSTLTGFDDPSGISGTKITNIVGRGHTVLYDSSLSANSALGGKTYKLANGGKLLPN